MSYRLAVLVVGGLVVLAILLAPFGRLNDHPGRVADRRGRSAALLAVVVIAAGLLYAAAARLDEPPAPSDLQIVDVEF